MSAQYRIVAHPSDVGFEAEAEDLRSLIDTSIRALADIETGGQIPDRTSERPLRPPDPAASAEERLMEALEQCLFWLDAEDWIALGVSEDGRALLGCELTEEARAEGTHVKAITWHHFEVREGPQGWSAVVFVDL